MADDDEKPGLDPRVDGLPSVDTMRAVVHIHSEAHLARACERAMRVLGLARRIGLDGVELPQPRVTLFADGSAHFFFPTVLAEQLVSDDTITSVLRLIGSDRAESKEKGVVVVVCCALGREMD